MTDIGIRARYSLDMLKAHQVYKNAAGKRVPGVTTVLGILDKPALLAWANRMGLEGKDINAVRDAAADIGTIAHARIEAHLRGMDFDETGLSTEALDKSATSFLRFLEWWDRSNLSVEATEVQMVSELWQVGGTADIVALRGDRRILVDIKTGKGIYREHRMQVAAYARMYEHVGRGRMDEVWIVRVGKEDADDIEPVEITNRARCEEAFAAVLGAYRALQAVK